jgi:transcriptional regulator with XRE-family HTH domain
VTLRTDAHVSQRRLSTESGVDQGHLSRVERGLVEPSFAVLESLAGMLGATVSIRIQPTTGPRIRDHIQARMAEALLEVLDQSWHRLVEVTVHRPSRGTIDTVLARPQAPVIAVELQSELRRLEQQIRWAADKAESLPSAEAWSFLAAEAAPGPASRLLVLRSTRAMRDLARSFEQTLRSAYPARTSDAYRALTQPHATWPGAAIIWADVSADRTRILPAPPRGVTLGR